MMRSDVTVCLWNIPAPLAGNTGFCLSRFVSVKQSGWLHNYLWVNAETCVHCTTTCPWVTSNLKQRLVETWTSISQNVVNKAVGQWREWLRASTRQMTSLWTSAKLKPALFSANTTQSALFRATNSLPRKTRFFASVLSQLFKSK